MLERSPERVAWLTLIAAQLVCAILALTSLSGGWWYFYNSSANLQVSLGVARGTIVLIDPATASREPVQTRFIYSNQQIVTADDVTQGTLQFQDKARGGLVIANITVFPQSQVRVTRARRPRFSFSVPNYSINLSGIVGRIEIEISADLPKKLELTTSGAYGEVILTESGLYSVSNSNGVLELTTYGGDALLNPINDNLTSVPAGHTAAFTPESGEVQVNVTTSDLVANPRFLLASQPGFPDGWACSSEAQNDMPRGTYSHELYGGRLALRFARDSSGPSEISCRQILVEGIDIQGIDLARYRSVRLRATFQIISQSVTTCGIEASECPLMLELTFTDINGVAGRRWHHGFYSFEYPGQITINRITCDTCLVEHERITPGTWYTYESPNLLELPPGYQPQRIEQIRFYSSGHAYEVYVAEVTLVADH